MSVGIKVKIIDRDHGFRRLFERTVPTLAKDPHVRVGVFASEGTGGDARDGGLTNVEIAAIHEFGVEEIGIPERSFLRSTFTENRDKYRGMIAKLLPQVVAGKLDLQKAFDIVGAQIVADVNTKVRQEGVPPPLAPETIARKGSSVALIDTARMLAAVTWVTVLDAAQEGAT